MADSSSSRNYQYIPLKTLIAMSKSPDDAGSIVNTTLAPPSILVTDGEVPDGSDTTIHQGAASDGTMVNLDLQEVDLNEVRRRTQSTVDPSKIDISYPIKLLKTPREIKIKLIVITLFLMIIAMTTCVLLFYVEEPLHFDIGHASLYVDSKVFELRHDGKVTRGWIGLKIPNILPSTCAPTNKNTLCVEWSGYATLRVDWADEQSPKYHPNLDCYNMSWTSYQKSLGHRDCYSLTNAHWYGGAECSDQKWPLEKGNWSLTPYLTGNEVYKFGPVAERYWISSHGVAVYVDKNTPLYVSVNEYVSKYNNDLCFEANYDDSPYPNANNSDSVLQYTMCFSTDLKTVHRNISQRYFDRPTELPNEYILKYPTWSTPACGKNDNLDQETVLKMVKAMNQNGFQNGTLEIKCGYPPKEGDLQFDRQRFSNASDMIVQIKKYGYSVAVSVNPFSNVDSKSFQEGVTCDFWVREARDEAPGLSKWNRGIASLLDTSSPNATQWFLSRLTAFQQKTGIDYFTFDYGEAKYLPIDYKTQNLLQNPCDYTTNYAKLAYNKGNPTVMRSVFQSQGIPVVLQTIPKSPCWNYNNGLKTIVPTVLTLGIVGYPYVMLDMVFPMDPSMYSLMDCPMTSPTNSTSGSPTKSPMDSPTASQELPDREIFIRWLEISAFLPAMKIPVPVWQYDEEVVRITTKWIKFHQDVIAPKVASLGQAMLKSGDPIIRPLWWLLPQDEDAQNIDSQFLIGDNMIVAPILEPLEKGKSKVARQVYLPEGLWVDKLNDHMLTIEEPKWVDVEVALDEVAYYEKVVRGYKTQSP